MHSATDMPSNGTINVQPFKLSTTTESQPSYFEISFMLENTRYRYGFEADAEKIHKEWLLESTKTKEFPFFLRMGDSFEIDHKRLPNSSEMQQPGRI